MAIHIVIQICVSGFLGTLKKLYEIGYLQVPTLGRR